MAIIAPAYKGCFIARLQRITIKMSNFTVHWSFVEPCRKPLWRFKVVVERELRKVIESSSYIFISLETPFIMFLKLSLLQFLKEIF